MAEKDWRMVTPCDSCPFNRTGKGAAVRRSLHPKRMPEIRRALLRGLDFWCHKLTGGTDEDDDDDGQSYMPTKDDRLCAGAIA